MTSFEMLSSELISLIYNTNSFCLRMVFSLLDSFLQLILMKTLKSFDFTFI